MEAYLTDVAQLNQPTHDHHLHEGAALRSAAKDRLNSQGEQWNGVRAAVCDALAGCSQPATADQIAEAVS